MRKSKHGYAPRGKRMTEYSCWMAMKSRCYIVTDVSYAYYGGRGITVCKRWRDSFPNFLKDMGKRPAGMTLDRRNTNGNYTPTNCRWATRKEQMDNRRNTRTIMVDGKSIRFLSACTDHSIDGGTVRNRLKRGWTPEQALKTPLHRRNPIAA